LSSFGGRYRGIVGVQRLLIEDSVVVGLFFTTGFYVEAEAVKKL
jgi:hypothetical protein